MSDKLRIAVWHNLPTGGAKRALNDQVAALVERGHYVESWCPPTADQTHLPLGRYCSEHVVPIRTVNRRKSRKILEIFSPYFERRDQLLAMDDHCLSCAEEINKGSFDLLFANISTFFQSTAIGKFTRLPSVFYLPEPARWLYEAQPEQRWMSFIGDTKRSWFVRKYHWLVDLGEMESRRLLIRSEIENARCFSKIIVNSRFTRENVSRSYGLESSVSYLGIDCNKFRPTGEERASFVIGLGSLHFTKGPDRAIEAIAKISREKRPTLVWVGNVADLQYSKVIRNLAMQKGVLFDLKVMVSDVELISLLSRARCMIYTSRLEPFGLAPLEANACGTAVVAVAEGGVRETIIDCVNGFLVQDAMGAEMAAKIKRLIDSVDAANRMGLKARNHVLEHWPLEKAIDTLEDQFYSCLASRTYKLKCND